MQYRSVGRSGLKVSPICFGMAGVGWWVDEITAESLLNQYFEFGGNFVDTANVYPSVGHENGGKRSEEVLGRWIKNRKCRDKVIIATKVAGRTGNAPNDEGLSYRHIVNEVENSLRRLQTDYIDLYQAHADYPDISLHETLSAFDNLRRRGLIRYAGCSNYRAWRLMKAIGVSEREHLVHYVSVQTKYNLVERRAFEGDLADLCAEEGIGCLAYNPLAKGFLSGRYSRDQQLPDTPRAKGISQFYFNEQNWSVIETLVRIATRREVSCSEIAIAWLLAQRGIVASIVGSSSTEQLAEVMKAVSLTLDSEELNELAMSQAER